MFLPSSRQSSRSGSFGQDLTSIVGSTSFQSPPCSANTWSSASAPLLQLYEPQMPRKRFYLYVFLSVRQSVATGGESAVL